MHARLICTLAYYSLSLRFSFLFVLCRRSLCAGLLYVFKTSVVLGILSSPASSSLSLLVCVRTVVPYRFAPPSSTLAHLLCPLEPHL
jgi:hypothetical protein